MEKTQTKDAIQSLLNAKNELMEVKPGGATPGTQLRFERLVLSDSPLPASHSGIGGLPEPVA